MSNKIIVWALFDSGNGSYTQVANNFQDIEIYPIGMDIERKNNHFINLDLADYSYMFGNNKLFDTLDGLPKPDLIIASPPCESWSQASAMRNGNACWKQEKGDSLFDSQTPLSRFTVRDYDDYNYDGCQFKHEKSIINRLNGELCTVNLIKIIKRYKPEFYIIENPASSRIWDYIDKVLGFNIEFDNMCYYANYDYPAKKATKFKSNINLGLNKDSPRNTKNLRFLDRKGGSYNARSNIPEKLVNDIFEKIILNFRKGEK